MHHVSLPYLQRTVRLFQSCHCLSGVKIPSLSRNYSSRSGLLLLHEIKYWTPASFAPSISIRFLNQETLINAEEKNTVSVNSTSGSSDQNHVDVLNKKYSLKTDDGNNLDGEGTRLQSTSMRPPKKLSCMELLDAFSSNPHSPHALFSTVMDLWKVLASNKRVKLSDKQLMSEHPNFYALCYEVMKSAPSMSNKFLVCGLFVFVSLEVNQNTRLIQTLLQVCQQRLSTFKVEEIILLTNCLKMMESDKTVDILKAALHLLIELKCQATKDVPTLQDLLRIAPAHLKRTFEEKTLQMIDKFTVSHCYNMFSILAEKNLHSECLLDSCSHKLIDFMDELSCKRIMNLTGHCSKLLYFNEKLLSAVGENIMNNNYLWNTWQISMVLTNMAYLRFRYVPLLNHFADKIMQDSQSLRINHLVTTAKVYSILNHLPEEKGERFLETLDSALHLHMNSMKKKELLKTVYSLCLLGLVPVSAINTLLEDKSLGTQNSIEESYLSHIKLCLCLELGSSPFSIQDLKKVEANHSHPVIMCHTFLKKYFKYPNLYQENMQLPSSYFIDFVLTLDREQNKLVPTGDIHNFESSQNITRIAVLCCPAKAYTLGSIHPVGKMAVKIRHLKSLGFTVVLVPVDQFLMLTEAKKVEFLRENVFKDTSSGQDLAEANDTYCTS